MRENQIKRALKNGQMVIGTMVSEVRGPGVMTMLDTAGFDFVYIDMEHSTYSLETAGDMITAAKGTNLHTIVRTPGLSRLAIQQPLDAGADGILVPQVENVAEVRQIVAWAKYFPMGERGMAIRRGHSNFAKVNTADYTRHANEETLVVIQIESVSAIEDIDNMVSVPGVDAAFIGPADLSQSYGIPGKTEDPRIIEGLMRFIAACNRHGVAPGIHVYEMEKAKWWIDQGMRLIAYGNDISMIVDTGSRQTGELKGYLKSKAQ
ncbi:MAG: HpcH/HpaI aldolase family protein [Bacillota bacterium]